MSEPCWSWTSRKELHSRSGAHIPLLEEILRELERLGWDPNGRDYFGVQMALEESLSNAIRHGNKLDESKRVHVECKASPERFWLRVTDEGPGFRSEEHTSELQSRRDLVCRLLLEKKKKNRLSTIQSKNKKKKNNDN